MNQYIMKENIQMTNKLMKIILTLLGNHFPIPITKEKGKTANIKCYEDEKQLEVQTFCGGNAKMIQQLWKRV